jgi:glycerophosphoryl diester phosphodiesterase
MLAIPRRAPLVLCALLLLAGPARPAEPPSPFPFFKPVQPARPVQVMAHRGMAGLAPENTLPAIEACAADFVEWAEIDVRLSKDGRHVLLHDATLDRTTNGKGKVADHTLAELAMLDAGAWFAPRFAGTRLPTLAAALAAAKGKVNLYLDCKVVDPVLLVKEVLATGMERQVVVYAAPAVLAEVRAASKGKIATMTRYRARQDLDTFLREVRPSAVEIDAGEVTPQLCKRFHAAGVKVQAKVLGAKWDNPKVWGRAVEAGCDWAQTDDPAGFRTWDVRKRLPKWPVKIAYHRGANRYAPENTLPAIRKAVQLGADYVEFDIRPTQDGAYVLLHDRTLNRTTTGKGPLSKLSRAEVEKLDAGRWFGKPFAGTKVPALEDVLLALGPHAHAYLDAKDIPPEKLLAAIEKHGLMKRHVVYQSPAYLARLKRLSPAVRLLPPLRSAAELDKVAELRPYGVDARWSALSKKLIADCHARGILVFSDALGRHDRVEEYRKAIRWGIDVIQTDHPLRVLRAIELELARK